MIPIADENPSGRKPYVVHTLVVLNILVYVINFLSGHSLSNWSMVPYSVIHNTPSVNTINVLTYGNVVKQLQIVHQGLNPQWLTIFTSMFMHASFMHIAGNMLYLWIFGNNLEDALGHFKFLLFYFMCGILAALAHIASGPNSTIPTVGASGAIAGVLGAYLYLFPRNRVVTLMPLLFVYYTLEVPAVFVLGIWFLTQLTGLWGTGGLQGGGVAYWAHIGGFIAGIILIVLFGGKSLKNHRTRRYSRRWD